MEKSVARKEGSAMEIVMLKTALYAEKPKLEEKFCVKISEEALHAVFRALKKTLQSRTRLRDSDPRKSPRNTGGSVQAGAGKIKRLCLRERGLSQALVDAVELCRDNHPDSQSWLKRVRFERDSASIYIFIDFLEQLSSVLDSSSFSWLRGALADKIRGWETVALDALKWVKPHLPTGGSQDLVRILNDIRRQLMQAFQNLLTVGASHVVEVVSELTDIPRTEVFYLVPNRKETAINKTNKRVMHQERVIGSIFNILDSHNCRHVNRKTARPRGLFLLLGSSGCGKTETAKAVAQHWYCDASRLVEIDMSEYAEPAQFEASSSSAGSKRKRKVELLDCISEVVRKRPYSVILLDKIDKAVSSVKSLILHVSSSCGAQSDVEGNTLDFSKSIILMTSDVGAGQPVFSCGCYNRSKDLEEQLYHDPDSDRITFFRTHICFLKGFLSERAVIKEAMMFFGAKLLKFFDKVFVMEFGDDHKKAVSRMLLREIVREIHQGRFLVHISDAALDVLLDNPRSMSSPTSVKAIKEALLADVRPQLSSAGYSSAVVYVDALVGSNELSFRFEAHDKQFLADRYFKQRDGTLGEVMANFKMKVQSAYKFFELLKTFLPSLERPGGNPMELMRQLLVICNLLSRFSPFTSPPRECPATRKVVLDNLPMVEEEKENIKDVWRRLLESDTGLAKASRIIIDAVVKIIDAPLQSHDPPARYYLFLCLDDDAKRGLVKLLTESLRSSDSGNSFFTFVGLNNDNCRGEEVKKMLIDKVKERPNTVFMLDGVKYADLVLYRSLVKIFDEGTLEDDEGFAIDFRRASVILISEVANKCMIAHLFDYKPRVLHSMATNQDVKRFRTELLHRVDEIILFDPILPEHEGILRLPKCDIRFTARPASKLLSTFLSKMFCPHYNVRDMYNDKVKASDVYGAMGTLKDDCC